MNSGESLSQICHVKRDRFAKDVYILTFEYEGGVRTTIRVGFNDKQSGAEMVITNMTTLPLSARGAGHGSVALESLMSWARSANIQKIQAVQVHGSREIFWIRNGFIKIGNATNDFQYIQDT